MTPAENEALEILMTFGKDGAKIMDSGGKDSTVLKYIADLAHEKYGLDYSVHHNLTTLDAPETVYFIRAEQKRLNKAGIDYEIHLPKRNFDKLCIYNKMLPTRFKRFCCAELKESYGDRERTVTGVRRAESVNRKKNQGTVTILKNGKLPEEVVQNDDFVKTERGGTILMNYDNDESVALVYTCFRTNKVLVNPLINWSDDDVYKCIGDHHLPLNPLYDRGFNRVGCIGCPMATYRERVRQFEVYPKYRDRIIRIADKIVEIKKTEGLKRNTFYVFRDGVDYFRKWMEDPNLPGQLSIDADGNITEDYEEWRQ